MPLSLLLRTLTDSSAAHSGLEEARSQMTIADALTLRRLALLALLERWEVATLQEELLDIVIKRDDPKELGIFLASSHLNKHLARSGVIGKALAEAAEKGLVYATSVLACRATDEERNRAAIRAANAGQSAALDCLLRACKNETDEIFMLRGSLVAAVNSGVRPLISIIINALRCAGQTRIPVAAVYVAASRGFDDVCRELLLEFTWSEEEKAKLAAVNIGFPSTPAEPEPECPITSIDDASLVYNGKKHADLDHLKDAVTSGYLNVVTALLRQNQSWSIDDIKSCVLLAAENGNYHALSRLILVVYERYLESEDEIQSLLGQSLIIGSRLGHSPFVKSLVRKIRDKETRERALYCACLEGRTDTVETLLGSGLPVNTELLDRLVIASASKGHRETLIMLKNRFPEHEQAFLEIARQGLTRAARMNDSVLAESSVLLLDANSAGGSATAASIVAKRHGYENVVLALKPLERGVSHFSEGFRDLISLDDDVIDRVLSFLDLASLGTANQLCKRFSERKRVTEQFSRCLLADFNQVRLVDGPHSTPQELTRLAVVLTSASAHPIGFEREAKSKTQALGVILAQAVSEDWEDIVPLCSALLRRSADANLASTVETLLKLQSKDGIPIIPANDVHAVFTSAVRKECMKALSVICRIAIADRRLSTRALVEASRGEANNGTEGTLFLMMAALSREALASRRERDAQWARRRVEWERRGGVWGPLQQEEERNQGKTAQERDWDDAVGGALRRAAAAGHREIVHNIVQMLRARGRIRDFGNDFEKAFEGACRAGFHIVVSDLLSSVPLTEGQLVESLVTAARNGQVNVARTIVMDGRVPLASVRSQFMDAARRGHLHAIQALLSTGAIGATTCTDAIEEATRRDHGECKEFLELAHQRLVAFEEQEGRLQ